MRVSMSMRWNTGRQYTPQGQEILAWRSGEEVNGLFTVRFFDKSRGIYGELRERYKNIPVDTVMRLYDRGHYDPVYIPDDELKQARSLSVSLGLRPPPV